MGELGALFNPGMRHELEERQAKAARREEEGNARDGDLRIDLESGVAVINIGADDDTEQADEKVAGTAASGPANGPDDGPARSGGRHAATGSGAAPTGSLPADDQDPAHHEEPAAEADPPVLRPRGKRGLPTGRHTNPEPARSSTR